RRERHDQPHGALRIRLRFAHAREQREQERQDFHDTSQTWSATSTMRASFASCSRSPSGLPLIELAKPHCGLSASCSIGATFAAVSILCSNSACVSTRALLVETSPSTTRL